MERTAVLLATLDLVTVSKFSYVIENLRITEKMARFNNCHELEISFWDHGYGVPRVLKPDHSHLQQT